MHRWSRRRCALGGAGAQQVLAAEQPPVLRVSRAVSLADSLFRLPLDSYSGRRQVHEFPLLYGRVAYSARMVHKDMGFNHIVPAMRNPLILALSIENLRDPVQVIDVADALSGRSRRIRGKRSANPLPWRAALLNPVEGDLDHNGGFDQPKSAKILDSVLLEIGRSYRGSLDPSNRNTPSRY